EEDSLAGAVEVRPANIAVRLPRDTEICPAHAAGKIQSRPEGESTLPAHYGRHLGAVQVGPPDYPAKPFAPVNEVWPGLAGRYKEQTQSRHAAENSCQAAASGQSAFFQKSTPGSDQCTVHDCLLSPSVCDRIKASFTFPGAQTGRQADAIPLQVSL